MEWYTAAILILFLIFTLIITGLPVAIVLQVTSMVMLGMLVGPYKAMYMISQEIYHFWSSWTLLAIPLFVIMGELLFVGGCASDIFDMVGKWLRHVRGGLALVSTGACAVFASMCGSSAGGTSTMAIVCVPEMLKKGYSNRLATGSIAASGALAHLIPPSVLMVVYASLLEISPGRALLAAVVPGVLLALFFAITVIIWTTFNPTAAPKEPPASWNERIRSLAVAWQPIILLTVVMGTMILGIATVTESAAMGAFVALIIALTKTRGNVRKVFSAVIDGARVSCFIMLISVSGKVLALTLAYYSIPQNVVEIIMGLNLGPIMIMVLIQILYLILGCFIDPIGIMVVTLPIVAPVLLSLGFDPYWFGVMLMINFEMALITPPMGSQLYIIKGVVPQVPLGDILSGALVFFLADIVMLVILYAFPGIALWLPSLMR